MARSNRRDGPSCLGGRAANWGCGRDFIAVHDSQTALKHKFRSASCGSDILSDGSGLLCNPVLRSCSEEQKAAQSQGEQRPSARFRDNRRFETRDDGRLIIKKQYSSGGCNVEIVPCQELSGTIDRPQRAKHIPGNECRVSRAVEEIDPVDSPARKPDQAKAVVYKRPRA